MKIMTKYQAGVISASLCASYKGKVFTTLKNETISLCEGLEEVETLV